MRRMRSFVPLETLKLIYNALVQPYFDYCSPLWDNCGGGLKDKLQRLQNRAARVIPKPKKEFAKEVSNIMELSIGTIYLLKPKQPVPSIHLGES